MTSPPTPDEIEALRRITTPTVCNAIETFSTRPRNEGFMDGSIVCRFPELGPMVGYAVTARIAASRPAQSEVSHDAAWMAFDKHPKPWVIVV